MIKVITDAQYLKNKEEENQTVFFKINGAMSHIPSDENNSDYIEILKQVADGTITIKDAE